MPKSPQKPAALIPKERIPLNEKIAWSIEDAADATCLSRSSIKKLIKIGVLKASRISPGRTLLDPRQVQAAFFPDHSDDDNANDS